MSKPQGPLPPPVAWAQRKNAILLTFNVEDCKKPEIKIEAAGVYIKGICGSGTEKKEFENTLELYGEIDPQKSKHFVRDRNIEMILLKKSEGPFWPHLLKQKMKYHWLKVDFTRWKDEDDSDDEAGKNPDLEAMMRQIGGLKKAQEERPKLSTTPKANEIEKEKHLKYTNIPIDEMADMSEFDAPILETETDISGIDKVLLLQRLWENTSMAGFGGLRLGEKLKMPFNKDRASKAVGDYIDYFDGRPIKCDISGDIAMTRLYDRDSSKPFNDVVKDIRIEMSELNKVD